MAAVKTSRSAIVLFMRMIASHALTGLSLTQHRHSGTYPVLVKILPNFPVADNTASTPKTADHEVVFAIEYIYK